MTRSLAGDYRWRRFVRAAALLVPAYFVVLWAGFWSMFREGRYAAAAAGLLTAVAAVSATLTAGAAWASRPTPRWRLNVTVISWALLPASLVALILAARGWPVIAGAGCAAAAGALAGLAYAQLRGKIAALQPVFVLSVDTISDAELLRTATQEPAADPRLPAGLKAIQRLNHARALTFLAMRKGDFDRLVEALPVLRAVLMDRQLDPAVTLLAARDLVEAESLLVQYGGDGGRYSESIRLLTRLVRENPGIPEAQATLHEYRAVYQQYLMTQASEDRNRAWKAGDQTMADAAERRIRTVWSAIELELIQAVRLTPERAAVTPQYLVQLGLHLSSAWTCLGEDRSDEAVGCCREALSLRAGRTPVQQPRTELFLARALTARYEQKRDERDADEAAGLLRRVIRHGNPLEARAREMLLELALLRPAERA